jgi:hypothetical protein
VHVQADLSGKAKDRCGWLLAAYQLPVHQEGFQPSDPMKTKQLVFLAFLAGTTIVRSQDVTLAVTEVSAPTAQSGTGILPAASSPARIHGPIPDGSPPPPAAPKPEYHIAARDILSTKTHQQGGRTITVREIKPIALPQPPAPIEVTPTAVDEEFRAQLRAYHAANPRPNLLSIGATVFRSASQAPRTLVRWWPMGTDHQITFWSSADFSLIAGGIGSFTDTAGRTHSIFMSWSTMDAERADKLLAVTGRIYQSPEIPTFPAGKATYQIIGDPPTPETLTAIQSLHDLYNNELPRLQTAYQGREQARLQKEAYEKANPPQPQNITLNYWRSEHPTSNVKH